MSLMTWKTEYSVGVTKFDTQHKRLIDLLNTLHDAMMKGQGQGALEPTLAELIRYTQTHFEDEEKAFAAAGYPESFQHRQEHQALIKQVADIKKRFDAGEIALSLVTTAFLQDWLQNHILGTDKRYGPFLNQHGIR
ncbi:MAG: hemerythrin family protein [Deltaproteobacteria bacterium]|nr:hemerythrin family protein [Deltaproteobacteria bacterium]